MIEPMYRVEMTPILQKDNKPGGTSTSFPVSGRVLEAYRGSFIGQFWHGADGNVSIAVYIRDGSDNRVIEADRLDPAIHAIWKEYFGSLSRREKGARILFAHRAWIAALVTSVIASAIVLSVDKIWFTTSPQAEIPAAVSQQ